MTTQRYTITFQTSDGRAVDPSRVSLASLTSSVKVCRKMLYQLTSPYDVVRLEASPQGRLILTGSMEQSLHNVTMTMEGVTAFFRVAK